MRKGSSKFLTSFVSKAGTFRDNHDYYAFVELDDFACWVVVDGIDFVKEQKTAELITKQIFTEFTENPTISRSTLKKYLQNAQKTVQLSSGSEKRSASLVMVVTDYTRIVWIVSGNARLYHFSQENFSFKSKDQSIAQLMVEAEKISSETLDQHDERHNLFNHFGTAEEFKPFISEPYELQDGDVMLLCTASFWENLQLEQMVNAIKEAAEPKELVAQLEENLLKKSNDTLNNYTLGAIYAEKVFVEKVKKNSSNDTLKKIAIALGIVAVVVLASAWFLVNNKLHARKNVNPEVDTTITQAENKNEYETETDTETEVADETEAAEETKTITDLASWKHPVKAVFEKADLKLERVELIDNQQYPIFYLKDSSAYEFKNDLLEKLAQANNYWDYQITTDAGCLKVTCDRKGKQVTKVEPTGRIVYNDVSEAKESEVSVTSNEQHAIKDVIKSYEYALLEAINENDFSKVEKYLTPGSEFYKMQKKLVADLYRRNIKEKLIDYQIKEIIEDYETGDYVVYVSERVGIKYSDKSDYRESKFNWMYIVNFDGENATLSELRKWDK